MLGRGIARFNRQVLNRLTRPLARHLPGFGVIIHRGRRTDRLYKTPVNVFRHDGDYVVALTYLSSDFNGAYSPTVPDRDATLRGSGVQETSIIPFLTVTIASHSAGEGRGLLAPAIGIGLVEIIESVANDDLDGGYFVIAQFPVFLGTALLRQGAFVLADEHH